MKIWIITQEDQDSNQSTSRIMNEDHTDHFILWHGEIRPTIWKAAIQIADPRKHCDLDNPVIDMDIISGKSIKQQAGDEPQIIKILHKWRNVIIEFLFFFFFISKQRLIITGSSLTLLSINQSIKNSTVERFFYVKTSEIFNLGHGHKVQSQLIWIKIGTTNACSKLVFSEQILPQFYQLR